ncbi:MAG: isoprenyl transferase, partial [Bdellovibrionales bacterium]|nr:isoprenyl transferase [Bdellovibrionales bacterium]
MDGNGRWAQSRGHNRFFGHSRGAKVAKMIIDECA